MTWPALTAAAALAIAAMAPNASAGPLARRCVAGSTPLAVGAQVLVVKRVAGSRIELSVCRRGSRRALRLGATFRNGTDTSAARVRR